MTTGTAPTTRTGISVRQSSPVSRVLAAFVPLFFAACVAFTLFLQSMKLARAPGVSETVLSLLLVGGPLVSYHLYREIRRTRRAALAGLMHAVALFFALMSLSIADLGSPITKALGKKAAPTGHAGAPAQDGPQQTASESDRPSFSTAPGTGARPNDRRQIPSSEKDELRTDARPRKAGPESRSRPQIAVATPAQAEEGEISPFAAVNVPDAEGGNEAVLPAGPEAAPDSADPYSLYDMLSLIGMIATVSLIVLGALVPEETRVLERRRDERRRVMGAFSDYSKLVTSFFEQARMQNGDEALALAVRQSASELELMVDQEDAYRDVVQGITEIHRTIGVDAVLARTRLQASGVLSPNDMLAALQSLRKSLEDSYPRQN